MQARMNDKKTSRLTNLRTLKSTGKKVKRLGGQMIIGARKAGKSNDGSTKGALLGVFPKLLLSGWHFASCSVWLVIRMTRGNSKRCSCVDRSFEQSRSHFEKVKVLDCPQASGKKHVLFGEKSNNQGAQLVKKQFIFQFESSIILYNAVCESHTHSHESHDLSSTSQETPITNLPDNSPSSDRRTSRANSRFPTLPKQNSTVNDHLLTDFESCSFGQPTKTQQPTLATAPKPTWWKNNPKGWSFASSSWMSVLAALLLLVPLTSTNAQQVLRPSESEQSNNTTTPTTLQGLWSPIYGLPVPRNEANILISNVDKTKSLNQNKKDALKQRNSTNFQELAARGHSNSDVTNKIEDIQQVDVFYHDPVAALPEEEIYLPPEIFDTGFYDPGFWNSSNNTFYEQEVNKIEDREQEDLNYPSSTTEDPFFRFFQTEMIAEHYDTSYQNRTKEVTDVENRNATVDLGTLLESSFGHFNNIDDVNNDFHYNSIGGNNSGVKNHSTKDKHKIHNAKFDESQDNITTPAIKHVLEDMTARSYKNEKETEEFEESLFKELDALVTRKTDRFKEEIEDDVYDFGWDSEIPDYMKDVSEDTEPDRFVNDNPRYEVPQDYVNDNIKSLGPQDYYVNDVPHVMPSKLEDENYHQSPSAGLWGHEVLSAPQWSHYPKIYRGMKRDRLARKTKNITQNKGGARIVASSHYELQYILGRKIIFLCVARGRPRPRITWYKDGVELYAHNYFQVHEWDIGRFKLKSKMEIDPATPMDAGYYKCEANNEQGVDQAGFRTKYRVQ